MPRRYIGKSSATNIVTKENAEHAAESLFLHAASSGDIYQAILRPLYSTLIDARKENRYNRDIARLMFQNVTRLIASKFTFEFRHKAGYYRSFPAKILDEVGLRLADRFHEEYIKLGHDL